jgi:hypothetical protein
VWLRAALTARPGGGLPIHFYEARAPAPAQLLITSLAGPFDDRKEIVCFDLSSLSEFVDSMR